MLPRSSHVELPHYTYAMLKPILHILRIVREEAGKRKWLSAVKALIALVGYVGVSVLALHPLLKWLFPSSVIVAWVVIVSLAIVIALLVVINFVRTYYERAIVETRAEWDRRDPILKKLYALSVKGNQLRQLCEDRSRVGDPLSEEDLRQVRIWHQEAAHQLESRLGNEYRRRFYEHSPTGETPPAAPVDCSNWMYTRLQKIAEVIRDLRMPPSRLISEAEAKQFEETGFLAGRVYDDD